MNIFGHSGDIDCRAPNPFKPKGTSRNLEPHDTRGVLQGSGKISFKKGSAPQLAQYQTRNNCGKDMVGVPKSKACSTCKQRKIKCGMERPSCSRCIDARFSCPGYPELHKFQDESFRLRKLNGLTAESIDSQSAEKWPTKTTHTKQASHLTCFRPIARASIRSMSTSYAERLARQLCETFRPELPKGKSLSMFEFVTEVPRHLGYDKALDLSVEAICVAHCALLQDDVQCLGRSRVLYGRALVELRKGLVNSQSSSEILCAATLLGIYELLGSTNDAAPIRHIGGASAILKANGPGSLNDALASRMLNSLRGMIVVEAITLQKRCFLDSPEWQDIAESPSQHPIDSLYSLMFKLPNILYSAREQRMDFESYLPETHSIRERAFKLHGEMQTWRENPAYQDMFRCITVPATEDSPSTGISYTSNKAAALLCTYAAMSILLNGVLADLCVSDASIFQAQSRVLAQQICQSRSYSLGYAPLGSCCMNFPLGVALEFLGSEP